jgi:deoxyinosine 3'endonuclease (endonuclease V)
MRIIYQATKNVDHNVTQIPYIPGYLGYREAPVLLDLLNDLKNSDPSKYPQVVLCDGNGILHPRGFGVACHVGIANDIPTIGVAKNLLNVDGITREMVADLSKRMQKAGDFEHLIGQSGKTWGAILRGTNESTVPIYVSIGHRVSLERAISLVTQCCKYRVPEPIRQADLLSRDVIRNLDKS